MWPLNGMHRCRRSHARVALAVQNCRNKWEREKTANMTKRVKHIIIHVLGLHAAHVAMCARNRMHKIHIADDDDNNKNNSNSSIRPTPVNCSFSRNVIFVFSFSLRSTRKKSAIASSHCNFSFCHSISAACCATLAVYFDWYLALFCIRFCRDNLGYRYRRRPTISANLFQQISANTCTCVAHIIHSIKPPSQDECSSRLESWNRFASKLPYKVLMAASISVHRLVTGSSRGTVIFFCNSIHWSIDPINSQSQKQLPQRQERCNITEYGRIIHQHTHTVILHIVLAALLYPMRLLLSYRSQASSIAKMAWRWAISFSFPYVVVVGFLDRVACHLRSNANDGITERDEHVHRHNINEIICKHTHNSQVGNGVRCTRTVLRHVTSKISKIKTEKLLMCTAVAHFARSLASASALVWSLVGIHHPDTRKPIQMDLMVTINATSESKWTSLKTRRNEKQAKNDTLVSNRMEWNGMRDISRTRRMYDIRVESLCLCSVHGAQCNRTTCGEQARARSHARAPTLVCRLCRLQQPVSLGIDGDHFAIRPRTDYTRKSHSSLQFIGCFESKYILIHLVAAAAALSLSLSPAVCWLYDRCLCAAEHKLVTWLNPKIPVTEPQRRKN